MSAVTLPLVWNEAFATGVAEIDEQHMILVHILSEASEKLASDSRLETLEQVSQELLSYALYHFETEEELMHAYGYEEASPADAQTHLQQHRAFSAKVVAVRDGLRSATPIAPADLLEFLNHWLVNHILNTDKRLGGYLVSQRAAHGS